MPTDMHQCWNHNTHYYRHVLRALPNGARAALDVGTGDGLLARELRERVPEVVAIDLDCEVLSRARSTGADVRWVHGDFMTHPLPVDHFELVAAVATVHHAPVLASALARLAALAAPGGRVVVIGCARPARIRDYLVESVGIAQHHVLARTRGFWQHSAPVQMRFPHTYAEARAITHSALPGARWRQLPLFRYQVVWTKPS